MKALGPREEFEAAVASYPTHNSAKVRLADYVNDDDHPDAAVKALREQIKALIGVSASVSVLAPDAIERTLVGKARRVIDKRPK